MSVTPLEVRRRWSRLREEPATLRISLLAGYTIDPLVPYLGTWLHDAGLPVRPWVGPYNQIAAQCLDDLGETARTRPEVLLVAPSGEARDDLVELADVALEATRRWGAFLVYVLPALPHTAPLGVGDHGDPTGVAASAVAAREAVRARLAGVSGVAVADAEHAVGTVGRRHAYHPAMERFARIPYTETVFAEIGRQVGAILRAFLGGVIRAVVVDLDGTGDRTAEDLGVLGVPLRTLHDNGVRLAVRGGGDPVAAWTVAGSLLGELWPAAVSDQVIDSRPLDAQLADLAASLRVDTHHMALVTLAPDREPVAGERVVALDGTPDLWPSRLTDSGVFDRLPIATGSAEPGGTPRPSGRTLGEYVAGLGVELHWREPDSRTPGWLAEMLVRTKEFTLGVTPPEPGLTDGVAVAEVRDRLGRYGPSVVFRYSTVDTTCVVDVFLISCPVLGKGVEDAAYQAILDRADQAGASTVVFPVRETGRNHLTVEFLSRAAARPAIAASGRAIEVRVEPAEPGESL